MVARSGICSARSTTTSALWSRSATSPPETIEERLAAHLVGLRADLDLPGDQADRGHRGQQMRLVAVCILGAAQGLCRPRSRPAESQSALLADDCLPAPPVWSCSGEHARAARLRSRYRPAQDRSRSPPARSCTSTARHAAAGIQADQHLGGHIGDPAGDRSPRSPGTLVASHPIPRHRQEGGIGHEVEQVGEPAMRIIASPTVQFSLDLQYPSLRFIASVLWCGSRETRSVWRNRLSSFMATSSAVIRSRKSR